MGETKDQMKPSKVETVDAKDKVASKGGGGPLGIFKPKKVAVKETVEERAQKFADKVEGVGNDLERFITKKRTDLDSEKGQETKNRNQLALLEAMEFHVEKIKELGAEYSAT